MPTLASPLRAGAALPLLWPTAPKSASSTWTTTPWVSLRSFPSMFTAALSKNLRSSVAIVTREGG